MTEVVVVAEGETEETFVAEVLAPSIRDAGVYLRPRLTKKAGRPQGGGVNGERIVRYLRNTLRERTDVYVTTFFDLYGLRADFPGVAGASPITDSRARASAIEAALADAVVAAAGCRPERFLPHIQPYEFEALLFSDVSRFANRRPEWQPFVAALQSARDSVDSPEHINDGAETHPSARLEALLKPRYEKVVDGSEVAKLIGLDRIRAQCVHFSQWLRRIEALQPL